MVVATVVLGACASQPGGARPSARGAASSEMRGTLAAGDDVGLAAFREPDANGPALVTVPISAD